MSVQPKKHLGQHFLTDKNMCRKIADQFIESHDCHNVLEIGPGMGALTDFLLKREGLNVKVMEIDRDSVAYLEEHKPKLKDKIYSADFLKTDITQLFDGEPFAVVGNFPYNISSRIIFKC
ncbi:MAG: rRNA adenine N-6-methyltransferase family protein, partial [Crocinitomicaceae bacterium]|nr:rRNA adenine N-6-methyltransferase family protein [Crocinitomicaceae bacterium]